MANGAPGIDGGCHYLSLGISQSALSPSETLHHLQHAYLWGRVMTLRGGEIQRVRRRQRRRKIKGDSQVDGELTVTTVHSTETIAAVSNGAVGR